ncbi:hypothetical protein [Alysiella filiformis]|uniref:Uncharacterized protein n=1 Tax=Alysiella filiformis DSM 16848 TaxID=1120981 RepID=A0A286E5M4_9NEIS|nr:hypothetical protein [Alysiella filiformis]QMT30342.1 hypothetical protein H3L97_06115 [Alysiella filiformis]UBQ56681.1 hypothetical protein JF568_02575 [Alysiella filiformis DSM 16848]SOD66238.1 hypothetical protein SAMN02746062_00556 [Alysiella filiformis DSM 16848]
MKRILLFFRKLFIKAMTSLAILLCWLTLFTILSFLLNETVSLFATQRYQQGDTPHKWFSVAVYRFDDKGERFVGMKPLFELNQKDELWQESQPYDNSMGFGVKQIGKDTYRLQQEIGLGMAYMDYRIENGQIVPLRFDHQWYISLCVFVALLMATYCMNFILKKMK